MTGATAKPLTTLFVISKITETSAPYNEHCIPASGKRNIVVVAYYRSEIDPPRNIPYYTGDGTVIGFVRAVRAALSEHNCNLFHAHSPVVGLLSLLATRGNYHRRLSTIFTVHNSFHNFSVRNRLLLLLIFAAYHKVICCGKMSAESFPKLYQKLARSGLCAIPNGVNIRRLDEVCSLPSENRRRERFTIASVGRLIDIKNPLTILKAYRESLPFQSRLVFIGDGYLRNKLSLERETMSLNDRVKLVGSVPRNDVYRWLGRADLFVSASRGEGLPVAALEAMACRCPVLLSDIEPHREIAQGSDFIPLVSPDDVGGFARQMARFARLSTSERREIGEKCRALVERRFSLETMQRSYEQVYAQALSAA